jgi:hypothetical protein
MKVDTSRVKHVYSGLDGKCCCGCAGKHTYTTVAAAAQNRAPTYVSDRTVAQVIRKITSSASPADDFDYGSCVGTVIGRRVYIAYYDH